MIKEQELIIISNKKIFKMKKIIKNNKINQKINNNSKMKSKIMKQIKNNNRKIKKINNHNKEVNQLNHKEKFPMQQVTLRKREQENNLQEICIVLP